MLIDHFKIKINKRPADLQTQTLSQYIHIDAWLFAFLLLLTGVGLVILYSASQSLRTVQFQLLRVAFAFAVMFICAQISPAGWQRCAPWLFFISFLLLLSVTGFGHIGKGAQRWLSYGVFRFQPTELMKLSIPLLLAWLYHRIHLPIKTKYVLLALPIIFIPAFLSAKQPDLGTAILLVTAGLSLLFLAGISFKILLSTIGFFCLCSPLAWHLLHDYQRQRILTFLHPEQDPLGKGYHIIQSKIAIGSGGLFGKGWLNGTQSNLHFLPEHSTDFIFAVVCEEFGLMGSLILMTLYMLIVVRCFQIAHEAQDTFSRLLAGSIGFTFFVTFYTNMGMVTGILPVVGIPLPLISYGGSSMVTIMASFGILMSIQTHRRLVTT